jgi:hypothetical protein
MAVSDTPVFVQTPKSWAAKTTAANTTITTSPDDTVLLITADATNGSLLERLQIIPQEAVAAASVAYLYHSIDSGTTQYLIDAEDIAVDTIGTNDAPLAVEFTRITEAHPIKLVAGSSLYVGFSTLETISWFASGGDY